MKFFIYKSLIICFLFFILFHLTFGYVLKSYTNKFFNSFSSDKINFIKEKIRSEVSKANSKETILNPSDAKLLGDFIEKINSEIKRK